MNETDKINALVKDIGDSIEKHSPFLDTDNMIAILLEFCRVIAETKGLTTKELRRRLKAIIDLQVR